MTIWQGGNNFQYFADQLFLWLSFLLDFWGSKILLSLFLINASTDLAQIFRRPSLCYVSYVCYVCHVILFLDNSS